MSSHPDPHPLAGTTKVRPLPPLPRMFAALPFVAVAVAAAKVAGRLCGCAHPDEIRASLPRWRAELDAKIAARRGTGSPPRSQSENESVLRAALILRDDNPAKPPMPFHILNRDEFFSLGADTRKLVHDRAVRQRAEHPAEPVPVWIDDDPAARP